MLTTACEPDEMITAVRFPVHSSGVAFREVARRHGDFAIIAVAAVVDDGEMVRLGVGGLSGRPIVRKFHTDDAIAAVEMLISEHEGYDDLHASARMRQDMLRKLAPLVIAEAQRCVA
jgi:2-furoyl-CoA dehydrogenase FAD binding subunit